MKETRQFIWTYAKIIFALFILGVAINMFLGPHHIAAGGVSGLGILLEAAFGFDRAIVILVLNIAMLVLALLFLGKKTFFQSAFWKLSFSFDHRGSTRDDDYFRSVVICHFWKCDFCFRSGHLI